MSLISSSVCRATSSSVDVVVLSFSWISCMSLILLVFSGVVGFGVFICKLARLIRPGSGLPNLVRGARMSCLSTFAAWLMVSSNFVSVVPSCACNATSFSAVVIRGAFSRACASLWCVAIHFSSAANRLCSLSVSAFRLRLSRFSFSCRRFSSHFAILLARCRCI